MLDLSKVSDGFLEPVARVVGAALEAADGLSADDIMVVGAWCRDTLHAALGHDFATTATHDIDLALALPSWDSYRTLTSSMPRVGDTGIRYRIAGLEVDLLPFGAVEDPEGIVEPPARGEPMSVWAFEEIFDASLRLELEDSFVVRLPSVAGFTAAKLAAWLDRSDWREAKDASDLALILYWYAESAPVRDRLYETTDGQGVLVAEGLDLQRSAAQLLGRDVADVIGPQRHQELLARAGPATWNCWSGSSAFAAVPAGRGTRHDARRSSTHSHVAFAVAHQPSASCSAPLHRRCG